MKRNQISMIKNLLAAQVLINHQKVKKNQIGNHQTKQPVIWLRRIGQAIQMRRSL